MFTPDLDALWQYKKHHQELLDEAQNHRLVQAALEAGMPKVRSSSKILAQAGKVLVFWGHNLEQRYGSQPRQEVEVEQQGFNILV